MENAAPEVRGRESVRPAAFADRVAYSAWLRGATAQVVSAEEIYEAVRGLRDPEYPMSLAELGVIRREDVAELGRGRFALEFTPTVPHCSQASTIGLSIKAALSCTLPPSYRVAVAVKPSTHNSADSITKQINDKGNGRTCSRPPAAERVSAALENPAVVRHVSNAFADSRSPADVIASSLLGGSPQASHGTEPAGDLIEQLSRKVQW